jgi:transposase
VKIDITPKKLAKIVAFNEHASMTVRDIASDTGVRNSSVSRILCAYKNSGSLSPKRTRKVRKKTRNHQLLLRDSRLHPTMTSKDLQRDLLTSRIDIDALTVRHRLLAVGRKARKQIKKQLMTRAMKQKRLAWASEYRSRTTDDWKKVAFSDESHKFVQGYRASVVRRGRDKLVRAEHFQQTVKHLPKCFGFFFSLQVVLGV